MNLPWWFPLPDAFVEKAAKLMTGKVAGAPALRCSKADHDEGEAGGSEVRDGMAKVNEQIESKFSAWLAFPRHHEGASPFCGLEGILLVSNVSSCQVGEKVDA